MHTYVIVVGNVGKVFEGTNGFIAHAEYNVWVGLSRRGEGRPAGEDVTLFKDGDISKEYTGTLAR